MQALAIGLVHAVLTTAAVVGVVGGLVLQAHGRVHDATLPAALLLGLAAAGWLRARPAPATADPAASRWPWVLTGLVLATVVGAVGYGALATASRHWDGAVAWDLKTRFLAADPTLQQPFFRDGAVFCHSRDYPLLQPLLVALGDRWCGAGRLLFPVALATAAAAIAAALQGSRVGGRRAALATLAFVVTPFVGNPTSGGFDSGYADGLLCTWLTVAAAGLVAQRPLWLALGTLLLVLTKPEGLPYAGVLVAATWLNADRASLRAAVLGLCAGALVQLPLQHDLHTVGRSSILLPVALAVPALGALVVASDAWLRARAVRRAPIAAVVVPLALLALPALPVLLGDHESAFGQYLADPGRALARIGRAPAVLAGLVEHAALRGGFGLAFVLPPLALLACRRQGRPAAAAPLGTLLLLLAVVWAAPFFLSPIDDLPHHLRSTLPRLLLHGTGVAWLCTARCLAALADGPASADAQRA